VFYSFLLLEWQNTHEDEGATYDISKISSVNVRVPRQENSFDCGVYILKYADYILENFIKLVDQRGNVVEVIEGAVGAKLEPFISKSSFTPADVNEKRNELVADMLDDMTRYSTLGVENEE
jgi:Ulp1 family protease